MRITTRYGSEKPSVKLQENSCLSCIIFTNTNLRFLLFFFFNIYDRMGVRVLQFLFYLSKIFYTLQVPRASLELQQSLSELSIISICRVLFTNVPSTCVCLIYPSKFIFQRQNLCTYHKFHKQYLWCTFKMQLYYYSFVFFLVNKSQFV